MADNRLLAQYNQPSQRNALLGNVSEEDSYRDMFARDPAAASSALLAGGQPSRPEPGGFPRAMLSMMPVTGNVLAAQDAWEAAKGLGAATNEPDRRGAMANLLLSTAGAVSPLPWGRTAGMVARDAKNVAPAFPAWHGSPHDFDEFKLDKIGTGEGAQAYGHGLYFAENPEVAKAYKENLSNRGYAVNGEPVHDAVTAHWADVQNRGGDLTPHLQRYKEDAEYWRQMAGGGKDANALERHMDAQDNAAAIERVMGGDVKSITPGRLYHTEIDAEPHQLLDWDKPFGKQPQNIQDALTPLAPTADGGWHPELGMDTVHSIISRHHGSPQMSQTLKEAGIPGIRYIDQGSRGQGGGTSNYVIFDDKLVKVKSKE